MYQVLDPKIVIAAAVWLGVSILLLFGSFGVSLSTQTVVAIADFILISVIAAKPVWRWIWSWKIVGPFLADHIYPDINGTYDAVLESNWPVMQRMLQAAEGKAPAFSPFDREQPAPALLKIELKAIIEQSWFGIRMHMFPKDPNATILRSWTVATLPINSKENDAKQLVYLFEQENAKRDPTDDPFHEGAAKLTIDRYDSRSLSGLYWNNRAWERGINAAGKITLKRVSKKTKV